ncbi:hypothetical protein [Nitrosophilus kaiyonis]|uniref:hypothetical protein n=1 Tax=Nitrosophilus kaiyonis TaxID=2930200 RepID=UPI002493AE8D|nr:hypothetical protein [Nitrosophilus kaiyonis]
MKKIVLILFFISSIFAQDFYLSIGGYENIIFKNKKFLISNFLNKNLSNFNSYSLWITKDWNENWYSIEKINSSIKQGLTPIFIFYWFEDEICNDFVKKNRKKYFLHLKKFSNFLKKIKGKKIVILNPEFNQNDIYKSKKFNTILIKSIKILKEDNKNTLIGFCLGDFGDYDLIEDELNWKMYEKSYIKAIKYIDFIAFQEMRALTRNKKYQILNTPYRAFAFAKFLYKRYKKPTFLAYLAISSYKDNNLQNKVLETFNELLPCIKKEANLIGINYFHLIDQPSQKGYFKKAEKFFGVIDKYGNPKKSFKTIQNLK